MKCKVSPCAGVGLFMWCSVCEGTPVTFQGLGSLPGDTFISGASAVSADGTTIVGASNYRGFRWTPATGLVELQLPGSWTAMPTAVSADGSFIGGYLMTVIPEGESFRWEVGAPTMTTLMGWISGISGDGTVVVGSALSGYGGAFRWTQASGVTFLGDLPGGSTSSSAVAVSADGRVIVGRGTSASGSEAFRWMQPTGMVGLGDLTGGAFDSIATAASADGSVIVGQGSSDASGSGHEAFRWTQTGGMAGLGDLSGGLFDSVARGVSADGSIVVGRGSSILGDEAFIWDAASGMRNLRDVLTSDYGLNLTGWQLTEASGVSADGLTIVGTGINPNGSTEAWVAHVPEPAALALLSTGALAVLGRRRPVPNSRQS